MTALPSVLLLRPVQVSLPPGSLVRLPSPTSLSWAGLLWSLQVRDRMAEPGCGPGLAGAEAVLAHWCHSSQHPFCPL